MKQNRSKARTVVRVVAFLLIAALLYGALARLLSVNDATEQQSPGVYVVEINGFLYTSVFAANR